MQLRDYQLGTLNECRTLMHAGIKSMLVVAPTGSGKTTIAASMLKSASEKLITAWFVVHRRELVKQSAAAFELAQVPYGIIANGFPENLRPLVQIGSIQTLKNRLSKLPPPRLIVWDECHHIKAASWKKVYESFPDAYHIGLSATPERLDGQGLQDFFQRLIMGPSVRSLIDKGYLCDYRIFAPPTIDVAGIPSRAGDYVISDLASLVDKPTITGDAIAHYQKLAPGKRAVVFCVSIEHSKHVVAQFQGAGISAEHVDGETDPNERDRIISRFQSGDIRVLSNVDLFGEGFDLPAIECAILLRPTKSLGLYLQQLGRVLRPFPGKTVATILDHAGNCGRHGFPDDVREWSLLGRAGRLSKSKSVTGPGVRLCTKCFAAAFSTATICTFCQTPFEVQSRDIEVVSGELVELDRKVQQVRARQDQSRAKSLEDLIELGRQRGYKSPERWAGYIFSARQKKRAIE